MNLSSYDILIAPLISEKATLISEQNKLAFRVHPEATKDQIAKAIELVYKVRPEAVNVINVAGKVKRFRGILGRRKHTKKAIVTLPANHGIEIVSGG